MLVVEWYKDENVAFIQIILTLIVSIILFYFLDIGICINIIFASFLLC